MKLKKKDMPWILMIAMGFIIVAIVLVISIIPHPDLYYLEDDIIILSGSSGQTATDALLLDIRPNECRIDAINITGLFFKNVFNETKGTYDEIVLKPPDYEKIFIRIGYNESTAISVGHFNGKSIYINRVDTDIFPIVNDTILVIYFDYTFPSESCGCRNKDYQYTFYSKIKVGKEV